ncbi:type II toxin-antitoxin system RelE/ParE family toxin [Breoghania sp. L-A4]|nr:type II toxin-antitoxin system RelE/ParE family toxin [Breoghania sp. L-A4]
MDRLVVNDQADTDMLDIWCSIAPDDLTAADRLADLFHEKFALLARHPELGRQRTDIGTNARAFPVGSYLILYRTTAAGVEIVRVIHGARDLGDLLDD